jgi:hypothetical protein
MANDKDSDTSATTSVETLKSKVDDARKQLDSLTRHGTAPLAEKLCIGRIQSLLKQLKDLHGVDY